MQSSASDTDSHKGIAERKLYIADYACLAGERFSSAWKPYMKFPFLSDFCTAKHAAQNKSCTWWVAPPLWAGHGWLRIEEAKN